MLRKKFWFVFSTTSNFSIFPTKVMGPDASEKVLGHLSEKGYWARCFGKRFGSSGGVREGFLGHPGAVQEASWGVLGLSGGVRGASWESLGRSWGDLGATSKAVRFRINFLIEFERQKGTKREAFGEPKWKQSRSQSDTKSKSIFKTEKTLFKTVLGAS